MFDNVLAGMVRVREDGDKGDEFPWASAQISIVASYNVGLFLRGQRLPGPGETVIADSFYDGGGGKGSNQAIAASVMGAVTHLLVRLGKDRYGDDALAMYDHYGISTRLVHRNPTIHSGVSVILIDSHGRNMISVAPGANFEAGGGHRLRCGSFGRVLLGGISAENRIK